MKVKKIKALICYFYIFWNLLSSTSYGFLIGFLFSVPTQNMMFLFLTIFFFKKKYLFITTFLIYDPSYIIFHIFISGKKKQLYYIKS